MASLKQQKNTKIPEDSVPVVVAFYHPPIIYTDIGSLDKWEKHFHEMVEKATILCDQKSYNKCYQAVRWARFCYAKSISMHIEKTENAHNLVIQFGFSENKHMGLFFSKVDGIVDVLA